MSDEPKKSRIKPMDNKDKAIAAFIFVGLAITVGVILVSGYILQGN